MTKKSAKPKAEAAETTTPVPTGKRIVVNGLGFTHITMDKRVKRSGVSRPHPILMGASELIGKRLISDVMRRAIAIMNAEGRRQLILRDVIRAAAAIGIPTAGFEESA